VVRRAAFAPERIPHLADAAPLYQRRLKIREKHLGPNHRRVASSLLNLALLYRDRGKYAKAEPLLRRGLEIQAKTLGPDHPNVAQGLFDLEKLYTLQGKYAEAEPLPSSASGVQSPEPG